jgi:hypothetical protein
MYRKYFFCLGILFLRPGAYAVIMGNFPHKNRRQNRREKLNDLLCSSFHGKLQLSSCPQPREKRILFLPPQPSAVATHPAHRESSQSSQVLEQIERASQKHYCGCSPASETPPGLEFHNLGELHLLLYGLFLDLTHPIMLQTTGFLHTYLYARACMYVCMYVVCAHVCLLVCKPACMPVCVCMYIRMYVWCCAIHTHSYAHRHTHV